MSGFAVPIAEFDAETAEYGFTKETEERILPKETETEEESTAREALYATQVRFVGWWCFVAVFRDVLCTHSHGLHALRVVVGLFFAVHVCSCVFVMVWPISPRHFDRAGSYRSSARTHWPRMCV